VMARTTPEAVAQGFEDLYRALLRQ
jgi:hypothetical protein